MSQRLEKQFAGNDRVVFLQFQTVFEGFPTNTFDNGLKCVKGKFKLRAAYGYVPGVAGKKRSDVMAKYLTRGTPWHIIIDTEGTVLYSDFGPKSDAELAAIVKMIEDAAAAPPAEPDAPAPDGDGDDD